MKGSNSVLTFGLTVAAIGMGTVFFALVLLVGVIKVMSLATALTERAKAPKAVATAARARAVAAPAKAQLEDDGEVLAVIAAAVAGYTRKQ